jgi:hypothetical protein
MAGARSASVHKEAEQALRTPGLNGEKRDEELRSRRGSFVGSTRSQSDTQDQDTTRREELERWTKLMSMANNHQQGDTAGRRGVLMS